MRLNFQHAASKAAKAVLALSLIASLAACERAKDKLTRNSHVHEGVTFKTKIEKSKESRQDFRVVVRNATNGLTGSREAARVAAARYCIENYGSTDMTFAGQSPDSKNEEVTMTDGKLIFSGRCAGW